MQFQIAVTYKMSMFFHYVGIIVLFIQFVHYLEFISLPLCCCDFGVWNVLNESTFFWEIIFCISTMLLWKSLTM
jgi:hypothetical protein